MGRGQRIGFAALAVLVALVALVLLGGGSDEETEQADAPPAAATSSPTATPAAEPEAEARATPTPTPRPRIRTLRYRDGEVVGGPARLEYEKGDRVRFAVASDVPEEIHVHGYDLYRDIPAGGSARVSFPADIEGIFEVELHGSGAPVAELRVEP